MDEAGLGGWDVGDTVSRTLPYAADAKAGAIGAAAASRPAAPGRAAKVSERNATVTVGALPWLLIETSALRALLSRGALVSAHLLLLAHLAVREPWP